MEQIKLNVISDFENIQSILKNRKHNIIKLKEYINQNDCSVLETLEAQQRWLEAHQAKVALLLRTLQTPAPSGYASNLYVTSDPSSSPYDTPDLTPSLTPSPSTSLYTPADGDCYAPSPGDAGGMSTSEDEASPLIPKSRLSKWDEELCNFTRDVAGRQGDLVGLANLEDHFKNAAETLGKMIISEQHVPNQEKKIKVLDDVGGIAGGSKFKAHGLFFKYPVDVKVNGSQWLYGGFERKDMIAAKASNHDMKGYSYVMAVDKQNYFNYPLFSLFDFQGFRLMVMTELPISKYPPTLQYGSADGGRTMQYQDDIHQKLGVISSRLNLREHQATNAKVNTFLCGDIEVHQFHHKEEELFFMLDTARIFPPTFPNGSSSGSIFYRLFRPEFVAKYSKALVSDALSGWLTDPAASEMNEDIKSATEDLSNTVKLFAHQMLTTKLLKKLVKSSKSRIQDTDEPNYVNDPIIERLHFEGINARYLGLLTFEIHALDKKNENINHLFTLMFSRALKNYWKKRIRMGSMNDRVHDTCLAVSLEILDFAISLKHPNSNSNVKIVEILDIINTMYCVGIVSSTEKNQFIELFKSKIESLPVEIVIFYFIRLCGIVLNNSTVLAIRAMKSFQFVQADITRFGPVLKIPPLINYYAGLHYYRKAKAVDPSITQTKFNYFATAGNKFLAIANTGFMSSRKYTAKSLLEALKLNRQFTCDIYLILDIFQEVLKQPMKSKEKFISYHFGFLMSIYLNITRKEVKEMDDGKLFFDEIEKKSQFLFENKMPSSNSLFNAMSFKQKSVILGFGFDKEEDCWRREKYLINKELMEKKIVKLEKDSTFKSNHGEFKSLILNSFPQLYINIVLSSKYWDVNPNDRVNILNLFLNLKEISSLSKSVSSDNLQQFWETLFIRPRLHCILNDLVVYQLLKDQNITDSKFKDLIEKNEFNKEERILIHSTFIEEFYYILKENGINIENIVDKEGNTALHIWSQHHCDVYKNSQREANLLPLFLCSTFLTQNDLQKYQLSRFPVENLKKLKVLTYLHDDKTGYITLHITKPYYNSKVLNFLINSKVFTSKMKLENNANNTPLHLASMSGLLDVVQLLTSNGWSISPKNQAKETPIYNACKYGHTNIVKHLLECKGNIKFLEGTFSPLHIACKGGHRQVAELLLSNKANIEAKQKTQFTPLHIACENGHLNCVKLLISRKANINAMKEGGSTPIFLACQNGNLDIVKFLVESKADLEHANLQQSTPFYMACSFQQLDVVKYLVSLNAKIDHVGQDQFTPLHIAARRGDKMLVDYLLSVNANINARQKNQRTPLYLAILWGHLPVVETLLEHKADIEAGEKPDISPLHIAIQRNSPTANILLSHGATIDSNIETLLTNNEKDEWLLNAMNLTDSTINKAKCLRILLLKSKLSLIDQNQIVVSLFTSQIIDQVLIRILMDCVVYSIQNGTPLLKDEEISKFLEQLETFNQNSFVSNWIPWLKFYLIGSQPTFIPKTFFLQTSHHVDISPDGLLCKAKFPLKSPFVFISNQSLNNGKWYFEVELINGCNMQIGYTTDQFQLNTIGQDQWSWGVHLSEKVKLHNGQSAPFGLGKEWQTGIIQCFLDLEEKIMAFQYQEHYEIAFEKFNIGNGIRPTISSNDGQTEFRVNFGASSFNLPIPPNFQSFENSWNQ